jgi:hypothetical protein
MVKPPLRTKSIGFKVSEEEYAGAGPPFSTTDGASRPLRGWARCCWDLSACDTSQFRQGLPMPRVRSASAHADRCRELLRNLNCSLLPNTVEYREQLSYLR